MKGLAKFSDDGRYRYVLGRGWGEGVKLTWIMLNPSTADADRNDPTIRRCIEFTKREGYDGFYVVNLFAYRSSDPRELLRSSRAGYDVVGPDNDQWILWAAGKSPSIVVGWGRRADAFPERVSAVLDLVHLRHPLRCFAVTQGGFPGHPLMLSKTAPYQFYPPTLPKKERKKEKKRLANL